MRSGSLILFSAIVFSAGLVGGQDAGPPAAPAPPQPIIRAEKKLVLVDAVVTDKHGGYVHDLTAQDFRVWEDKKEQKIESFSFEADPKSPAVNQKHYLVLFFDNSDSSLTDQMIARKAALKFLDAAGKPNWMIAVADFGGSLQIVQNFTNDTDRLKQVVNGTRFGDNPGELASLAGGGPLGRAAYDFGARDVLLALRSLAKSLGTVPGRKTLIFLSPGFPLNDDLVRSELTALLDTCNKANVAIYPIDVKGLSTSLMLPQDRRQPSWTLVPAVFEGQHAGGGGGGATAGGGHGGGAPSGGGGGTHGGAPASGGNTAGGARTGNAGNYSGYNYGNYNRNTQPRTIWPHMNSIVSRQELLYALASGTGGFVIVNTNDLTGGLEKIANEQNEYYVLGYSPSEDPEEGSCHQLKVKVDRGGTEVRARTGYCTEKPLDLLAGTPTEKTLEARVFSPAAGNVKASMETPFFYTGPNTARVNVSMEISPDGLKFEKEKGKFRSEMHVLGVAYGPDGSVAAKFSDTIKLEVDGKKELEDFKEKPVFYAKQFDIASGNYLFKVAFTSAGDTFGKLQAPLIVEPYDNKKFGLSAIALSDRMSRLSNLDAGLDAQLLEDVVPLVAEGVQIQPSGSNVFKKGSPAAVYVEIYDPLLASANAPPKVGLQLRVIDPKTGQSKVDTGFMNMANFAKAGSPIMPVGLKLPDDTLGPGTYKLEAKAMDTAGNTSVVRTADFVLQ